MKIKTWVRAGALAAAAVLLTGAAPNWIATVAQTGPSHRIGNPEAKVQLAEYISYTCPHCAQFAREGESALQLAYIAPGTVSLEVRHLIRDPIDLTVAVLAHCGPAGKFPQNHSAFMLGQDDWMAPLASVTEAQEQRWTAPGVAGRRAIAADFKLYDIMVRRGYRRAEIDRCLADEKLVKEIEQTSDRDWDSGLEGTPSFAINGTVLAGVHSWGSLSRRLDQSLRDAAGGQGANP